MSARSAQGNAVALGRAFRRLYRKDLESLKFTLALFSVLIAAWDGYLLTRVRAWEPGLPLGLSFIPLAFIPFWIIWDAIQSYRSEWHSGTIYFVLSAPVPGWIHALSKLAAVATSFTAQSALALGGTWSIAAATLPRFADVDAWLSQLPSGYTTQVLLGIVAVYWILGVGTILHFQAAYVASQLANRLQLLVLLAALAVEQWVVWRMGGLGHYLFAWVPDFRFTAFNVTPQGVQMLEDFLVVDSGPVLGCAVAEILFFVATAWLLQRAVEVS
ncbi:MAG: hypothetical protein IMX02_13560 [Limnochordaceae bacterium]|nr:hypothetical protein [Limnochordaceae bacterium]